MACARLRRLPALPRPSIVPGINKLLLRAEMPMLDVTTAHEIAADARVRANVVRLAAAQALTGANSAVIFATGSIVGATLAPDMSFATVPISMYVLGLAAGTLPTGAISRRFGRRVAFIVGTGLGTLTGLLRLVRDFACFVRAVLCRDLPRRPLRRGGAVLSLRCRRRRERGLPAESGVLGDGGRRVRRRARSAARAMDHGRLVALSVRLQLPGQAAVALIAMGIVAGVDMPKPAPADLHGGRPLLDIVTQPRFIAAALCGVISYPMMNLVMTSAPLAMKMCGLSVSDSNFGIQWHIVAMYGPSFFTGALIARFGARKIVAAGLLLEAGRPASVCPASPRCISGPR